MKHLYYSTTLCYCQTLSLHEYLSKCLKKWHLNIVVLFSPYDNAKCTKTEQGFRTCDILQTAPHTYGLLWELWCFLVGCHKRKFTITKAVLYSNIWAQKAVLCSNIWAQKADVYSENKASCLPYTPMENNTFPCSHLKGAKW